MKFFIVFACALAAASAGYAGPIHTPVIGPNGVPVDTAEVQHARAAHYAATVEAQARNGDFAYAPVAYAGYYGVPAVAPNGVPLDTAEVAAAKVHHFAAHAEALARNGHLYRYRRGIYAEHVPVIHNGVPVDTPEVQHAKAAHFAAKAEVYARNGAYAYAPFAYAAPAYYPYAYPAIQNGVPVDTAEVQQAKAAHFAAKAEAYARDGAYYYAPTAYSAYGYSYPQHVPVINNGVPVETPEVQHAKAAHFAAHAEAAARAQY